MDYAEWEKTVPSDFREDTLWRVTAYRLSLFLSDLSWIDCTRLSRDNRTSEVAGQLYRALGSIGANMSEGYSRRPGRDRAKFYEYSLGSARESRDWYYRGRGILGEIVVQHRLAILTGIVRLLSTMAPQQRSLAVREPVTAYGGRTKGKPRSARAPDDTWVAQSLLVNVPTS